MEEESFLNSVSEIFVDNAVSGDPVKEWIEAIYNGGIGKQKITKIVWLIWCRNFNDNIARMDENLLQFNFQKKDFRVSC